MAVKARELESNRLNNPRANLWHLICFGLGFSGIAIVAIWDLSVFATDKILGIEYHNGMELFGPIISVFGERGWKWPDFLFMALGYGVVLVTTYWIYQIYHPRTKADTRVDSYARSMGWGEAVKGISKEAAFQKAQRILRIEPGDEVTPGLPLGKLVIDHSPVYSDWEAEMLIVAGPRTGKSVGFVIPHIVAAPGPCIATSNKRDIVDGTRQLREGEGRKVWLFDPEGIAGATPDWYWNPISGIRHIRDAKDIAACWRAAAGLGSSGGTGGNDEFFNGSAEQQLTNFLFAAAVGGKNMRDVFKWCQNDTDDTAAQILSRYDYKEIVAQIHGMISITAETKSGIYAGLKKMVAFMVDEKVLPWIQLMDENDNRPKYDPFKFALSRDTLYLLSQKGANSTPITAALTAVTAKAGYDISQEMGGRLPVPLVGILDECANICPWPEMPEIFSYYGSCGIIINAVFQNPAQAETAFGKLGWENLWNNANTKVFLGGVSETNFLNMLSTLIGQRDVMRYNVNNNYGWTDTESQSLQQEQTLSPQQLAEMPEWRGVVFSSQNRAALLEVIPWFKDPILKPKIEKALKASKDKIRAKFNVEDVKRGANETAQARLKLEDEPAQALQIRVHRPQPEDLLELAPSSPKQTEYERLLHRQKELEKLEGLQNGK